MESFYRQYHEEDGWQHESYVSCYMQRAAKNWSSGFPLKNGIPFTANFGYNMYDTNYNLASDNLMASGWNWK
jgi:hypothetical protein